ncbi:MAG: hypothetical protein WBN68_04780, partial [Sedimenticolaceae bacterium]
MRKGSTVVIGIAILFAAQQAQTEPDRQTAGPQGAYEGIVASENAVWIVDTRSGRVRKCTQEFSDQTPR